MVWRWKVPAPKSGCKVTVEPMKLMMLSEFGSTGAAEMSVFHRFELGNGTKPFRLAPWLTLIPLQVPLCANRTPEDVKRSSTIKSGSRIRRIIVSFRIGSDLCGPSTELRNRVCDSGLRTWGLAPACESVELERHRKPIARPGP